MLTEEQVAVRAEFDRLINMSADEQTAWYATEESDFASLDPKLAKKFKKTSGKTLGKQALALKQSPQWTDEQYVKAAECTRSIKMFLGRQVAYTKPDGTLTAFAIALKNRGHDPLLQVQSPVTPAALPGAPMAVVSEGITTDTIRRSVDAALDEYAKAVLGGSWPEGEGIGNMRPWARYDGVYLIPPSVVFEWLGSLFRMAFVIDAAGKVALQTETLVEVTMEPVPVTDPDDAVPGVLESVEEAAEGKPAVWTGVMIRAGKAINRAANGLQREYTEDALKAAVEEGLFDNVPGYDRTDAEHSKREEADVAGHWGKAIWDATKKAVVNTFVWAEGKMPKAVNTKIKTLVAEGKTAEVPGFSVVANILTPKGKPHIVASIEEILSCDPVGSPSAGGVVLAVNEATHTQETSTMKVIDALKAKGIAVPAAFAQKYDKQLVAEGAAGDFMLAALKEKRPKMFEKQADLEAKLLKDETLLVTIFSEFMEAEGVTPPDPTPAPAPDPNKTEEGKLPAPVQEALDRVNAFALDGMLAQSGLDAAGLKLVRARLSGQPFDAAKVSEAITDVKDTLAEIRRGMTPTHLISGGADQKDKVGQAWNDLFMMDTPDPQVRAQVSESASASGLPGLTKHRGGEVRSIKRLAEMTLGRQVNWLDREEVQEAMDSVIAAKVLVNGMNLRVAYKWALETEYTHYRRITNVVPLPDMKTKNILTLGSLSDWSAKNSSTGFGTLTAQGAVNQSYTPAEVGGIHYIEWKNFVNDDTDYFRQIPDMHYDQAILYINALIWGGLVNTTATLADAAAVFSATRGNLVNFALDAEGTGLEAAVDALQNMGRPGAVDENAAAKNVPLLTSPGFLWTSSRIAQRKLAHNLTTIAFGQANNIATYAQNLGIMPIVNPLATDANDWGLFGKDPRGIIEMGVYGSETPIITIANDPGVGRRFTHNEIGVKGELEVAAAWVTHRNAVYAQVAG